MPVRAQTQTTTLGRYRVVKRLANGGMADVLLARTDGIEGFERHVVIKRIHAALLDEPRYVKMFLDEARLAASLHHHNIVQVNDIGEQHGEYFFAMEYVHGEDARALLVNASDRRLQIPLPHVITIVCGAAAGLHHAHEQRGADRAPLGIVHRDVSPANILVGFDGSVKVADFGIALAAHRAEQTQSGVLKGKVAYMSPEQCNCERVDRRSDVFSLGICLYELATVHPCFAAANDFMTMKAIVEGRFTPPSHLSAAIDPALESIILKALARDPADRYQTADELRGALEEYATAANIRNSTAALADYMAEQFGTRALPWQHDGEVADGDDEPEILIATPPVTPLPRLAPAAPSPVAAEAGQRPIKETLPLRPVSTPLPAPRARTRTLPMHPVSERPPARRPDSARTQRVSVVRAGRGVVWIVALVVAVVLGAVYVVLALRAEPPRPAARQRPRITPLPAPRMATPPRAQTVPAPPTAQPAARPASSSHAPSRPARKAAPKPAPAATPKWDPDTLFPQ